MLYIFTILPILKVLAVLVVVFSFLIVAFVTVAERKTMASMQRRLGPTVISLKSSLIIFTFVTFMLYVFNNSLGLGMYFIVGIINVALIALVKDCFQGKSWKTSVIYGPIIIFTILFIAKWCLLSPFGQSIYDNFVSTELGYCGFYNDMRAELFGENIYSGTDLSTDLLSTMADTGLSTIVLPTMAYAIAGIAEEYPISAYTDSPPFKMHNIHVSFSESRPEGSSGPDNSGSSAVSSTGATGSLRGNVGMRRDGRAIAEILRAPSPVEVVTSRSRSSPSAPVEVTTSRPNIQDPAPTPGSPHEFFVQWCDKQESRRKHIIDYVRMYNSLPEEEEKDNLTLGLPGCRYNTPAVLQTIYTSDPDDIVIFVMWSEVKTHDGKKPSLKSYESKYVLYRNLWDTTKEIINIYGRNTKLKLNMFNYDDRRTGRWLKDEIIRIMGADINNFDYFLSVPADRMLELLHDKMAQLEESKPIYLLVTQGDLR